MDQELLRKLKEILARPTDSGLQLNGEELLRDPRRLREILKETCPRQPKREISALVAVLEEGIPQLLQKTPASHLTDTMIANCAAKVTRETGLQDDVVHAAIEAWVLGLRLKTSGSDGHPPSNEQVFERPLDLGRRHAATRPRAQDSPQIPIASHKTEAQKPAGRKINAPAANVKGGPTSSLKNGPAKWLIGAGIAFGLIALFVVAIIIIDALTPLAQDAAQIRLRLLLWGIPVSVPVWVLVVWGANLLYHLLRGGTAKKNVQPKTKRS